MTPRVCQFDFANSSQYAAACSEKHNLNENTVTYSAFSSFSLTINIIIHRMSVLLMVYEDGGAMALFQLGPFRFFWFILYRHVNRHLYRHLYRVMNRHVARFNR